MSTPGDDTGEMTPDRIFSDEQAEALLGGRRPADSDDDALAAFFRTAKATAAQAPDEATQALHLAAIAEATSQLRSAPRPRSSETVARIFRPRWAKVTAGAIAVVFATGGLAAADVLPDPAQDAVASIAANVGIDLPDSDEDDAKVKAKDKDGMDHDGDGVADDNGKHRGQNKTGKDHDGDGVADDNGKRAGDDESDEVSSENSKRADERVQDAQESTEPGPERGEAVSDAASSNRQDDENSNRRGPKNDDSDDEDDDGPGRGRSGDRDEGPPADRGRADKGRSDDGI